MYSCVSLLLLAGNLSREHMIRITIVRLVGKVHFRSDYYILGHDKASFPKIRFIRVGYVIVKDFCQVSISFSLACYIKLKSHHSWKSTFTGTNLRCAFAHKTTLGRRKNRRRRRFGASSFGAALWYFMSASRFFGRPLYRSARLL